MTTLKDSKFDSSSTKELVQRRIKKLTCVLKALSIVESFCLEIGSNMKTRSKVVFILTSRLINSIRPKVQNELDFWKKLKV